MYRHDNPLKPRTDSGLWIGGALAIVIVLGIVLYGVTRTDETGNEKSTITNEPGSRQSITSR